MSEISNFDFNEEYKEIIEPKIRELAIYCRKNKIPFFATFCVASNDEDTTYIGTAAVPFSFQYNLKHDNIRKMVVLQNNFDVVPGRRKAIDIQSLKQINTESNDIKDEQLKLSEMIASAEEDNSDAVNQSFTESEEYDLSAMLEAQKAEKKNRRGRYKGIPNKQNRTDEDNKRLEQLRAERNS